MSRIRNKFIQYGGAFNLNDVSAYHLPLNFTPTNYTPAQVLTEGNDKVSAHLKGIDTRLATVAGQGNVGVLTYANSGTITTNSQSFTSLSLTVNRESNGGTLFTKVNDTDFRTNFNGQVEVSFAVSGYLSTNDRAFEACIQRNNNDLYWTHIPVNVSNTTSRMGTSAGTFVLNCSNGDIFELRVAVLSNITLTIGVDEARFSIKTFRVNS